MRLERAMRACARVAVALAALSVAGSAYALNPPATVPAPAVAVSGDRAAVAWTAGGVVQVADLTRGGTFGPAVAVGRSITNRQPQLAFTPAGEALVLWQSGGVLRVAARVAGRSVWTVETIASFSEEIQPPRLFVDHGGRAIAIWTGVDTVNARALLASTRSVAGVWNAAVPLAIAPTQASMAIDSDGDVTVAYRARTDVSATTLLSGASSWSPAVEISGSDDVFGDVQLAGGGERTFLATWGLTQPSSSQNMQPIVRSARLRAPGTWSPPRDVVSQSSDPLLSGVTYEEGWESAVDGLGNAVTFLRFPILTYGYALAVTRLPASGDEWAGAVPFSLPDLKYAAVSLPSTALADDGATSLAFVQRAPSGVTMRVSTSARAGEAWAGPVGMVGTVTKCKARCESDFGEGIEPAVAIGKRFAIVAIQSAGGEVVAFARSAPGGHWKGPQTLRSTGPTTAYLVSAHVRKGVIRVVVACGLPPCTGVADLQASLGAGPRLLGRVAFSLRGAGTTTWSIRLPAWTRARLAPGRHLLTHFAFKVREGDGMTEQVQRTIRLHA